MLITLRAALISALLASIAWAPAFAEEPESVTASRAIKQWVRAKVVRSEDLARYGLKLEPEAGECDPAQELVVMIHGFNSTVERTADFFAPIREAQLPCATFQYPNDHALGDSAKLLSTELRKLAAEQPKRSIALVAYSMGGLVARACIEDPALDPGNVRRLIMVATPNHGSLLAHMSTGTDCWEHVWNGTGNPFARGRAAIADGLGEAVEDLQPGSDFLVRLNARQRNPAVRYTLLLGTNAQFQSWEFAALRRSILKTGSRIPFMKSKFQQFDEFLADMDEVVAGRGDGVVALKRGKLEGVDDTLLISFDHLTVTGPVTDVPTRRVHDLVLDRLTCDVDD